QMEENLGLAKEKGVKIVANAGGLNPAGLADALRELAVRLGLDVSIAHVEGDDLIARAEELGFGKPLTAYAYLGAWGIAECLRAGADVVVTGRVTATLLYEITGAQDAGPDVTTRFDTLSLTQEGPDRVRISGARGEAPPPTLKVALNKLGGFRNETTFVLTGLDIEEKAALVREQLEGVLKDRPPAEVRWTLARTDHHDADTEQTASALLHGAVKDADPQVAGRAFPGA